LEGEQIKSENARPVDTAVATSPCYFNFNKARLPQNSLAKSLKGTWFDSQQYFEQSLLPRKIDLCDTFFVLFVIRLRINNSSNSSLPILLLNLILYLINLLIGHFVPSRRKVPHTTLRIVQCAALLEVSARPCKSIAKFGTGSVTVRLRALFIRETALNRDGFLQFVDGCGTTSRTQSVNNGNKKSVKGWKCHKLPQS